MREVHILFAVTLDQEVRVPVMDLNLHHQEHGRQAQDPQHAGRLCRRQSPTLGATVLSRPYTQMKTTTARVLLSDSKSLRNRSRGPGSRPTAARAWRSRKPSWRACPHRGRIEPGTHERCQKDRVRENRPGGPDRLCGGIQRGRWSDEPRVGVRGRNQSPIAANCSRSARPRQCYCRLECGCPKAKAGRCRPGPTYRQTPPRRAARAGDQTVSPGSLS
jgi:hypothetical protein